ncbi:helix-turn-helix domain-containing protein [Poseidonocella sedimentorum]|nr:XRE family transcriptional regulator [Poseidonocella sedimentorum]
MPPRDPETLITIAHRDGRASAPEPLDLAKRVRELRVSRGWTLEQAAQQAGLARSTLSKIENGNMSPTFDLLKKLATGLAISIPQLFTPAPETEAAPRLSVTRGGEGEAFPTATYEHDLLAETLPDKRMLPYHTRIRARAMEEFEGWVRHDGEEFLYVLTGAVRLFTEYHAPVDLRRGDSVYYDARMGHNVISISEDDATILWVTSLT